MKRHDNYKPWAIICAVAAIIGLVAAGVLAVRSVKTQGKTALDITNRVCVPILLYHHVSADESMVGEFCITPAELENDLIYLTENGYTPIHISQLVEYCYSGTPLPSRPIVISFDGSFASGYYHAFALLQKYNTKAVFSVVAEQVNDASKQSRSAAVPYLRWSELGEMVESELVELANQSYGMNRYTQDDRRGIAKRKSESTDEYYEALYEDVMLAQQDMKDQLGVVPITFVYPYGIVDRQSINLISELGFAATLGRDAGANYLSQDPANLFELRRTVRKHGDYTDDVLNRIYRTRVV